MCVSQRQMDTLLDHDVYHVITTHLYIMIPNVSRYNVKRQLIFVLQQTSLIVADVFLFKLQRQTYS